MPVVVDEARVRAGDGHAAWSESFNELFAAGRVENCQVGAFLAYAAPDGSPGADRPGAVSAGEVDV